MTYFYHSVADSPHLPRDIAADSAQGGLLTVLGECWPSENAIDVASAGLVALLETAGISPASSRAAFSRMTRRGTLVATRRGRQTFYRLSEEVAASVPRSALMTVRFGLEERDWGGEWVLVVFSFPETQRDRRQTLREWLRWLGFGPLRDGVWIAPHADLELTRDAITDLLPEDGLIARTSDLIGNVVPDEIWHLDELAEMYKQFTADFRPFVYQLREGSLAPTAAFRVWLDVLANWRRFPTLDPDLPAAALPIGWPRGEARRVFEAVHDGCAPLVAAHARTIIGQHDPASADQIRVLSVKEAIVLYEEDSRMRPNEFDLNAIGPLKSRAVA